LRSVEKALETAGANVFRIGSGAELKRADAIVVPGQGHFGQAMEQIHSRGFEAVLRKKVLEEKVPYIGICIGYQILFEESEEAPGVKGLGWLKGRVVKFRGDLKVPHMGWNEVRTVRSYPALAAAKGKENEDPFFYFVHSYYPVPADATAIVATCEYGGEFAAAINIGNIFAVQFHPEKSQEAGRSLLKNLIDGGTRRRGD